MYIIEYHLLLKSLPLRVKFTPDYKVATPQQVLHH
jgi:hypothetical protein